jgi:hypothetical protein
MGFFNDAKSVYKKSEAAVVVQNLLEHQAKIGLLDVNAQQLANRLVTLVWEQKPDIFDGKFGQRPHKISVAAAALANGLDQFAKGDTNRSALVLSLGTVLSEIETNGRLYSLTGVDQTLIEAAAMIFSDAVKETESRDSQRQPQASRTRTSYASFESWYAEFKTIAGKTNPQLAQSDGKSLLDFMDHEPLRRAYRDGVSPATVAVPFAKSFDIRSFGRR